MPLCDDGIRPLAISVVSLRSHGKGPEDVKTQKSRRPHLFVLFPDAIQLFTTSDAGEDLLEGTNGTMADQDGGGARAVFSKLARKPVFLSRNATRARTSSTKQVSRVESDNSLNAASESNLEEEDSADLEPGQVFRLYVTLAQLLSIEVVKGNRLLIWYQPNKPSQRGTVEEQTMMVLRTILSAMDYRTSSIGSAGPPSKDAHHFTVVFTGGEEALDIKYEVERAQRQLALATLWLSDGLPLRSDSAIVMATVNSYINQSDGTPSKGKKACDYAFAPVYALPLPQWGKELTLPMELGNIMSNPGSRQCANTGINVYLHTPLGRALAEIPCVALLRSAAEGGLPLVAPATLQDPLGDDSLRPGKCWKVLLQWRASKGPEVNPLLAGCTNCQLLRGDLISKGKKRMTESGRSNASISSLQTDQGERHLQQAQVSQDGDGRGSLGALLGLVALSGMASLVRGVRTQFARLTGPSAADIYNEKKSIHEWRICFLDLEIDEEVRRENLPPSSPPVRRAISVTAATASEWGIPAQPSTVDLPNHIKTLIQQYPTIITADIAQRFIVGLGSENKAYSALSSMAQWTKGNGFENIVRAKQPAFETIKKNFPHGFMGWSRRRDCLVEFEAIGSWSNAYDAIVSEGVTEQQMLEHYLFIYQYAFTRLDARPLPNGKTVKIVDLQGLSMSQLKSPGFKFLTRVGAMLSLNYPQRLHRCFLLNAPGWWAVAWRIVSPIIPPKVREQMVLFGKNDQEAAKKALLEWVDEDVLSASYGGGNNVPMSEWEYEMKLKSYVQNLNLCDSVTDYIKDCSEILGERAQKDIKDRRRR